MQQSKPKDLIKQAPRNPKGIESKVAAPARATSSPIPATVGAKLFPKP